MTVQPAEKPRLSNDTSNLPFVVLISVVATLGGFLFGFDSGVINGTVDGLRIAFDSDSVSTGFNVASMLLGCAAGAFIAGNLADRFGRRNILVMAAVFFVASAWGSGVAGTSAEFVFWRILGGLAVGASSILSPAYISEVAPARYRGALATLQQIAIITGLFIAFVSNYLIAHFAGSAVNDLAWGFEAWRWMFWVEMVPASIFLAALLFIPESPRFLVVSGQRDRALLVLTRLLGAAAESKEREIYDSLASDHHAPSLRDVIDKRIGLKRLVWVGVALATFQQLVGINVVFYYGAVLWQSAGFAESDALLINVFSGGVSIAACIATVILIDRIGRKPILLFGSIGMAVTLSTLVVVFGSAMVSVGGTLELSDQMGLAALIAANAYVVIFNFSWGPVMWVMLSEMFPNQLRGSGLAVSGLAQWLANFGVTLTFPVLLATIGLGGAYGLYAAAAFVSIAFVYFLVHETRGVELEDMQA